MSTLEAVRRLAEQEMRREAPRLDGEKGVKRRRVGGGDDVDGGDDEGEPTSTSQSWLRFAYDASSALTDPDTPIVGFVVSSQIRKEASAAREARGRLCSLLGVEEVEEEEEGEEVEGEKTTRRRSLPTLSPVKIGCRGLGLLVYRGKKKELGAGAASRAVGELVRGVSEEKEKKKSGDGGKDDGASERAGPFAFVRRVVPVDAAVVEGGPESGNGSGSSSSSVADRLSAAVKSLVSRVDVRSLVATEPSSQSSPLPVVRFAVCYRRHVPSEHEGGEGGGKEEAEREKATTTTTNTAAAAGLACRPAVVKAAAQALAESLPKALSGNQTSGTAAAVDLKTPHVVLCVEVLPLSHRCLVATLALLPRSCCDKQLRVQGVE